MIYTIGHSNHEWSHWLGLLVSYRIDVVADVRSIPYSRFSPQFSRRQLEPSLGKTGRCYEFFGRELGGIPEDESYYDDEGHVSYEKLARGAGFVEALDRLAALAVGKRVALMCGEEDPTHCHRRLLVARALIERKLGVTHIRGDGTASAETDVGAPPPGLFDDPLPWRSHRPVRRR